MTVREGHPGYRMQMDDGDPDSTSTSTDEELLECTRKIVSHHEPRAWIDKTL